MAQVSDPRYGNWVKDTLCLLYVKEGIVEFIDSQSGSFHTQLTTAFGNNTCACSAHSLIRGKKGWAMDHCNGICRDWLDGILSHHRLRPPVIPPIVPGNVNPKLWPTDFWEVMKTYQPKGCQDHHSAVDVDIAGLLCLMNNCDHFFRFYNYWHHLIDEVMRVRDRLMHSNDFLVEDSTLAADVQKMLAFLRSLTSLSVAENLPVQAAIDKIEELHLKTLELSVDRELELTAIRVSQAALQAEMRNLEQTVKDVTMDTTTASSGMTTVKDKMDTVETDVSDLRDKVDTEVSTLYNRIDTAVSGLSNKIDTDVSGLRNKVETEIIALQSRLQTHVSRIEGLQKEITSQHQSTGNTIYSLTRLQEQFDDMTNDLKQVKIQVASLSTMNQPAQQSKELDVDGIQQTLIKMYKSRRRHVPLHMLGPERKAPIEDIYVEQRLKIVDPDGRLTPKTANKSDKYLDSLRDVFYSDGHKCQYIYISGNAGYGKSVFCSHIVSLWCIAHLKKKTRKLTINEEMMAEFPLLFCVDLRDITLDESDKCSDEIAQLIKRQLHLSDLGLTDDGLHELLQADGKVLVLMDALDECKLNRILKTGLYNMCTFIVTSRPWKLEVLRRDKEYQIDKELEIISLNKASCVELSDKLVEFLNKKWHTDKKSKEFIEKMVEKGLEYFLSIPVLHTSMLCLWFGDKPFGQSQSSVYGNLIHHQLLTAIHGKALPPHTGSTEMPFPVCQTEECPCKPLSELLWKVSELSFQTLLGSYKEHSLVMDHDQTTLLGLSDKDVDLCMKIGILTQYKLLGNVTDYKPKKSFSFTHKTFQEWFCAVYLSKLDKSELSKLTSDLNNTLELEKIFVFLCGLDTEVAAKWTHSIMEKVSKDQRVQKYRRLSSYACSVEDSLIRRIQEFVVAGVEEILKENAKCTFVLPLNDIYISSSTTKFSTELILSCDTSKTESIYIQGQSIISSWPVSTCIANVVLINVNMTHCDTFVTNFSATKLSVLHLKKVTMTHEQAHYLYGSLISVDSVYFQDVTCSTHEVNTETCITQLDLSLHVGLKTFSDKNLRYLPRAIITKWPVFFGFENIDLSGMDISSWDSFSDICSATRLSKLHLFNVTMTHQQAERLYRWLVSTGYAMDIKNKDISCRTHAGHREECNILIDLSPCDKISTLKLPYLGRCSPEISIRTWPPGSYLETVDMSGVDIAQCCTFSQHFSASRLINLHLKNVTMTYEQICHMLKSIFSEVNLKDNHFVVNLICRTRKDNRGEWDFQYSLSLNEVRNVSVQNLSVCSTKLHLLTWLSPCIGEVELSGIDVTMCDSFGGAQFSKVSTCIMISVTMTHVQIEDCVQSLMSAGSPRNICIDNLTCSTHADIGTECTIQIDMSDHKGIETLKFKQASGTATYINITAWPSGFCLKIVDITGLDITRCDTFSKHFSADLMTYLNMDRVTMTHEQIEHLCERIVSLGNMHMHELICRTHRDNNKTCNIQVDLSHHKFINNLNLTLAIGTQSEITALAWPPSSCLEHIDLNKVDITQCDTFIERFSAANLKSLKLKSVTITHGQIEHLCKCLASAEKCKIEHIEGLICKTHEGNRNYCEIKIDLSDCVGTSTIRVPPITWLNDHMEYLQFGRYGENITELNIQHEMNNSVDLPRLPFITAWPSYSCLERIDLNGVDITQCDTFIERFSAANLESLELKRVTMTHGQIEHLCKCLVSTWNCQIEHIQGLVCTTHEGNRNYCEIKIDLSDCVGTSTIRVPPITWLNDHMEYLQFGRYGENITELNIQHEMNNSVDLPRLPFITAWPSYSCLERIDLNGVDITQCDTFIERFSAANLESLKLKSVIMTHGQIEHLFSCLGSAENIDSDRMDGIICRTHIYKRTECKIQIDLSDNVDAKRIRLKVNHLKTDLILVSWPPSSCLMTVNMHYVDITRCYTFSENFSANHLSVLIMTMVTMTHSQLKHINESLSAAMNLRWVVLSYLTCRTHESSRTNCKIQIDLAKYKNLRAIFFGTGKGKIDIDIEAWSSSRLDMVSITGLDISHCETFSDLFSAIFLSQFYIESVTMAHAQITQMCRSLASTRHINSLHISDLTCRTHGTGECTLLRLICPLYNMVSLECIRSQLSNVI